MLAQLPVAKCRVLISSAAIITALVMANGKVHAEPPDVQRLIEAGRFTEAEKILRGQIADAAAPITGDAAVQLEIIRRTRHDFPLSAEEVLKQIQKYAADATQADVDRWREAGDLQARTIDGETRYFREAVGNLFRFNAEAKARRGSAPASDNSFDMTPHVRELVRLAEASKRPEVFPLKHRISYSLAVNEGHPRLKPGAQVRAWLPYPKEYRYQRDVRLIRSEPPGAKVADNEAPQRAIYFERTIAGPNDAPRFSVEFEFITSAFCPQLDAKQVQPYDKQSHLFAEYTTERAPHIVYTPQARRQVREIVGDELNPLEKARRIFRWVSQYIPWCSEMEYSIIPNISAKGLTARRGDCGVKGMTFITLCRAAGVPARWQSGWQMRPGDWNMHDWAEFYVEPWGWLPCDASYGVRDDADPRVRDFYCGHIDGYRMIVNTDFGRELQPPKTSFRSEPNDFQRGEVEIDGHNLYFDEWDWKFEVVTSPLASPVSAPTAAKSIAAP